VIRISYLIVVCCAIVLSSCKRDYQPKPLGYNRLVLPEHEFVLSPDTLPYRFEYSKHARFLKDTSWVSDKHWVEVYYPELKANIHITYKRIKDTKQLKSYFNDAFVLTAKHQIKANAIDEIVVKTPSGKTATVSELNGEVPSQFQFTITDSTTHFVRGAVYFFTKVSNDSLAPAIDYVKKDAMHLINTLDWRYK
jgi:gliding motility-associated lipoprotein GldD